MAQQQDQQQLHVTVVSIDDRPYAISQKHLHTMVHLGPQNHHNLEKTDHKLTLDFQNQHVPVLALSPLLHQTHLDIPQQATILVYKVADIIFGLLVNNASHFENANFNPLPSLESGHELIIGHAQLKNGTYLPLISIKSAAYYLEPQLSPGNANLPKQSFFLCNTDSQHQGLVSTESITHIIKKQHNDFVFAAPGIITTSYQQHYIRVCTACNTLNIKDPGTYVVIILKKQDYYIGLVLHNVIHITTADQHPQLPIINTNLLFEEIDKRPISQPPETPPTTPPSADKVVTRNAQVF